MKNILVVSLLLLTSGSEQVFASQKNKEDKLEKANKLWKKKHYSKSCQIKHEVFLGYIDMELFEQAIDLGLKLGNNYKTNNQKNKALKVWQKSNELAIGQNGELDSITALTYHKVGVGYFGMENYSNAISSYQAALDIREKLFSSTHPDISKGYQYIGWCNKLLGNIEEAIINLKTSYKLQKDATPNMIFETCRLLAITYRINNDYKNAEIFFLLTLEEYKKHFKDEPWTIGKIHREISTFYLNQGQFLEAISHLNLAKKLYLNIQDKWEEDYRELAKVYNNLGLVYLDKKNYEEALQLFYRAYKICLKNSSESFIDRGDFSTNIGITLKLSKQFDKALIYFQKAFNHYSLINSSFNIADTHNNLGDLYFDQNQYQKALKNYHQSLPYLLKNFQEKDEYINPILKDHYIPDKQALLVFLEAKAKTFKALYDQNHQEKDLIAAHETYELLDELIDDIRLSYLEDASKSYLVKQAKPIYEKAIGLCLQYHKYSQDEKYLEEAFKYAEKSKSIILLEQIKESRANIAASIPDSVQQKERQLKREIGQIEKKLALQEEEVTTDSLGKSLREQLIRVKNEYEDLVKNLEKDNKEYHQLKYDLQTVDIQTIQKDVLKEGQQLVEYFVGVDSMYIFKIDKEKFDIIARPLDFDLKALTDSLRQGIYYCRINNTTTNETCEALDRQYEAYAVKLYQKLIAPLNLTTETQEIIFIPDGVLGYIPFDALLAKAIPVTQQNQFQNYPYFGLEKVMSYAFSATFLKELQQTVSTIDNHQLLAFAPSFKVGTKEGETLEVTPSVETKDPIFALRSNLSPLLFNEREVEQIEANFSGKSYINQQANKLSFIQEAPNYRYLHIASHGKMNDEDADLSYIAFTQDGDSTNQEELLYLRELYDMDIPADMVVLSACETGIGELQNGEGIISLARGFSYAGAKSIITSLWSVNDQKTTDLMVDFYQNLKEGQTKNYALANAKRDYILDNSATFSHPFYWAGFIPIGNMERVEAASDWTWWIGLGVGSLLVIGFGLLRKLKS